MFKQQLETRRHGEHTLTKLLRRPETEWSDLVVHLPELAEFPAAVQQQVIYDVKYEGYITRQQTTIDRHKRLAGKKIPDRFDYEALTHLRLEAKEKLSRFRPASIDQAGRISGITPADIAMIMLHLEGKAETSPS